MDYWGYEYSLYVIAKTLLFSMPIIIILMITLISKINKINKR